MNARRWLLACLAGGGLALGCDPFHTQFDDVERAVEYRASKLKPARPGLSLRVMNYNVKFGGARIDFFFDCFGDRVLMSKSEV
ncbi:MAG TPA: hypothetical protein VFQ35_11890, partial [Polyangiaceae bacterium]|nr:hypothetical protein [Polyangiaceae bacterium]